MSVPEGRDQSDSTGLVFFGSDLPHGLEVELINELSTADEALFIVAFIRKAALVQSGQDSGFLKALKHFTEKNRLKVITSVYMGSTEKEAVDTIASLKNTEVRISYDCETNPLHAKSYIFLRKNKENTVFIGI